MVRPWVMFYSAMDLRVRVARTLGAKFPYCPMSLVLLVKELNQIISRVTVCALGVSRGRTGGHDDWTKMRLDEGRKGEERKMRTVVGHITEIEPCFWIMKARSGDNLAEYGGLILYYWLVLCLFDYS